LLSSRMPARPLPFDPFRQRPAFALGLDFQVAHPGLQLQKLQLPIAERFATRTVLPDALQPQALFQYLDFEVGPLELPLQFCHLCRFVRSGPGGLGDQ
jgi:hypothetical protein